MRTLIVACLALLVVSTCANRDVFEAWKQKYNKQYESAEHQQRAFSAFVNNLAYIEAANKAQRGSLRLGLNRFF